VKIPLQAAAVMRQGSDPRISLVSLDGVTPHARFHIKYEHLLGEPRIGFVHGKKGFVENVFCDGPSNSWCYCPATKDYVCCPTVKKPNKCQTSCC